MVGGFLRLIGSVHLLCRLGQPGNGPLVHIQHRVRYRFLPSLVPGVADPLANSTQYSTGHRAAQARHDDILQIELPRSGSPCAVLVYPPVHKLPDVQLILGLVAHDHLVHQVVGYLGDYLLYTFAAHGLQDVFYDLLGALWGHLCHLEQFIYRQLLRQYLRRPSGGGGEERLSRRGSPLQGAQGVVSRRG